MIKNVSQSPITITNISGNGAWESLNINFLKDSSMMDRSDNKKLANY